MMSQHVATFELILRALFCPQAACFTALGFIFMTMSLTFIGLDWSSQKPRGPLSPLFI